MLKLFNHILVPVDFSEQSLKTVDKAVELAVEYNCRVTLLHVVSAIPYSAFPMSDAMFTAPIQYADSYIKEESALKKIMTHVRNLHPELDIQHAVKPGSWNECVIDFSINEEIDLILIGVGSRLFRKRKMRLNPDRIAEHTEAAVITIPTNRRITRLFSVVIPVTDFLPVRKLMYGIFMATSYNSRLLLLGINNEKFKDKPLYYLQQAFSLVSENSNLPVEKDIIFSDNIAEAVESYSRSRSADLIILNPSTQTRMPGFLSSLFGSIIQKTASPPVLTITQ